MQLRHLVACCNFLACMRVCMHVNGIFTMYPIYIYIYLLDDVCNVCMYACMYACICMHAYMYVCMCVCIDAHVYMYMSCSTSTHAGTLALHGFV